MAYSGVPKETVAFLAALSRNNNKTWMDAHRAQYKEELVEPAMALVEAMWLGRPVVATRAGSPAEIVSDGVDGLLVPPGEPKPLAEAMRSLLLNPVWARSLGTQAAVRARQFDSTSMVDDVLLAYEDTVQRAAGGV